MHMSSLHVVSSWCHLEATHATMKCWSAWDMLDISLHSDRGLNAEFVARVAGLPRSSINPSTVDPSAVPDKHRVCSMHSVRWLRCAYAAA